MKCDCKSYNRPDWGGETKSVILDPKEYFPHITETVCVDVCIKDEVLALWEQGIWTIGSCCGHNGHANRTIIVENPQEGEQAKEIVGEKTKILAWKLMEIDKP